MDNVSLLKSSRGHGKCQNRDHQKRETSSPKLSLVLEICYGNWLRSDDWIGIGGEILGVYPKSSEYADSLSAIQQYINEHGKGEN